MFCGSHYYYYVLIGNNHVHPSKVIEKTKRKGDLSTANLAIPPTSTSRKRRLPISVNVNVMLAVEDDNVVDFPGTSEYYGIINSNVYQSINPVNIIIFTNCRYRTGCHDCNF